LKSAVQIASEIHRGDFPFAESNGATRRPSRLTSEVERLLVLALWWIVIPAALVFALYPSKSIDMHLKPEPPAEFHLQRGDLNAQQRADEDALAQAYWTCATQSIQYKYAYNKDLPVEPPPQFNIDSAGTRETNPIARDRYWENLREVWTQPEAWEKSYVTNSSWVSDIFTYIEQIIRKYTTAIQKLS
jgi:hypothetical protein